VVIFSLGITYWLLNRDSKAADEKIDTENC